MLDNKKCILAYGLSDEEIGRLQKLGFKVIVVTSDMAAMTLKDIVNGLDILNYNDTLPEEKVIIFNNFDEGALKGAIKRVRQYIKDGILATVTPVSAKWTFEYLLNHLVEEREWMKNQKGR